MGRLNPSAILINVNVVPEATEGMRQALARLVLGNHGEILGKVLK